MTAHWAATVATRVYEPEGTAAAYRLGNLVRALERAGYQVTVLTSKAPGGPASTRHVRRWPVLRDRSGVVRGYLQYLSFDIPLFFRLLFGPRADVVIVEPPPTTGVVTRLASWLRRTPYVYFAADVLSSAVKGVGVNALVVAAVRWLERRSLKGACGILAVSNAVEHEILALGARAAQIEVVGTGIDTEQFTLAGPIAESDTPYFIYAGTLSEVHGAGVFLDAFATLSVRYPDVSLHIFGAGVDLEELKSRAIALGDRVTFSGLLDAAKLAPLIRGATASLASVRPERGYDFAFATKALASLSCGTPVIYAGVGPIGSLVTEHDLGWATAWNADDVSVAMERAIERPRAGPDARLSAWVEEHHSLHATAANAVTAINRWLEREGAGDALS